MLKGERRINRIIFGIIIFIIFLALCSGMENFTTTQFVVAKAMAAVMGWATWKQIIMLHEENRI